MNRRSPPPGSVARIVAGAVLFVVAGIGYAREPRPSLAAATGILDVRVANVFAPGLPTPVWVVGVPESTDRVEISLERNRTVIASGRAFPVRGDTGSARPWYGLVGVESRVAPGEARLRLRAWLGTSLVAATSERVSITERAYRRETIDLSGPMTALRRDPDPRKVAQSRQLWAILQRVNDETPLARGTFASPVAARRTTSPFGTRRVFRYSDGDVAQSIHNGVDFGGSVGTPITAPAAGRVVLAQFRIVTGGTVVIEHGPGVHTLYFHLSDVLVEPGQSVDRGARVGTLGATGLVTGPHLHWETRVFGVPVDPEWFLNNALVDFGILAEDNLVFERG